MQIKTSIKDFIKIKDLNNINNLEAEISKYFVKNDIIEGTLLVKGSYDSFKSEVAKKINNELPFKIVMLNNDFSILDIDCDKFDYVIIENQGLEISYDVILDFEEINNSLEENVRCEEEFEECKELYTKNVEEILENKFYEVKNEDSLLDEKKMSVRVFYFKNEQDLNKISEETNYSISQIYSQNKNNDVTKFNRIIMYERQS